MKNDSTQPSVLSNASCGCQDCNCHGQPNCSCQSDCACGQANCRCSSPQKGRSK